MRRKIQAAYFEVVKTVVPYLKDRVTSTRGRQTGSEIEPAKLVVGAFEHGTLRAGEVIFEAVDRSRSLKLEEGALSTSKKEESGFIRVQQDKGGRPTSIASH